MSDYWTDLVNRKEKTKYRYFRTEVDSDGEAKEKTIVEINFVEERDNIKEQIQEDLRAWVASKPYGDEAEDDCDELCQIVVDNFKDFD